MGVSVFRASIEQLNEVVDLFDAYRCFYQRPSDKIGASAFISERLQRKESIIYLANCGNAVAGFIQVYPSFSSVSLCPIWILNDLFVYPEYRRQKVADQLMQFLETEAKEQCIGRIVLETAPDNDTAQALYRNRGYLLSDFHVFEKEL